LGVGLVADAIGGSWMSFEKGDLIGILKDDTAVAYVITKVVRDDVFFFAYSIVTNKHRLVIYDPQTCFMICPRFNPGIDPDESMSSISTEMYDALERLFGFFDADETSLEFDSALLIDDDEEDTED
jgi:hypothetical protein